MKHEFKLQDPGEGVHEVEIIEIMISKGDEVSEGQDVMAVESDKAAVELPSPFDGTVAEIHVSKGDTVTVGDVLMIVQDEAEEEDEADRKQEPGEEKSEPQEDGPDEEAEETASQEDAPTAEAKAPAPAEESSGKETREDRDEELPQDDEPSGESSEGALVRASPAARKLAREKGVDLSELEASGNDGQVTVEDVKAAAEGERPPTEAPEDAAQDDFGPVERQPISAIRAATARAMTRSWTNIPHVTHEDAADITELELWRRRQDDADRLSLTPIVVKAAVAVLKRHPRFNATFDAEAGEIVLRNYWNMNVAIATDRGLMTPVLKDADRKSARDLAGELETLADKARGQQLGKAELRGGTFTITNVGALGGRSFAPLIKPPQTAILGLGRARIEPRVTGDLENDSPPATEARMMLPLVLAFDHRALDGADAARFVNELAAILSDPVSLALEA